MLDELEKEGIPMKKNHRWYIAIVISLVMILSMLTPAIAAGHEGYENGVYKTPLLAGQDIEVGSVIVWNDGENLYVKYELNEDAIAEEWGITETHLHIARSLDDFPYAGRTKNPVPGQFDYQRSYDPPVTEDTYMIPLGDLEPGNEIFIGAHAVVKKIVEEAYWETKDGTITPVLSWMRSSEDNVASFPGKGAQWSLADGFAIALDPEEVVWDGGTLNQNIMENTTPSGRWPGYNSDLSYATYIYAYNNGDNHNGQADLRRFQGSFDLDIPENAVITSGQLGSVNEGYEDMIPINDNIYIFVNENLLFWGGTLPNATTTEFEGIFGKQAQRGGISPNWDPVETDGWFIPGTIPEIGLADFNFNGNTLDIFVEEYSIFGAFHELFISLDYEYEVFHPEITQDETAWGDGDRFTPRGNWATYFTYTIQEVPKEPASVFYGVAGDGRTGGLYQITVTDEDLVEEELIALENVGGFDGFSPNGLAYDEENHRLYYAVTTSNTSANLYFYNLEEDTITLAGEDLPGRIYGATFGAEKYWYTVNGTDDMYTVSFEPDGTMDEVIIYEENFAGGKSFNFGDIALDAGELIIYGSTSFSGTHKEFFSYDLNKNAGDRYQLITDVQTSKAIGLQLAFAEDENLYGHSTFAQIQNGNGEQEWFIVDKDGSAVSIGFGERGYNDLATGGPVK